MYGSCGAMNTFYTSEINTQMLIFLKDLKALKAFKMRLIAAKLTPFTTVNIASLDPAILLERNRMKMRTSY